MKARNIVYVLSLLLSCALHAQTVDWKWGRGGGGSANDTGRVVTFDSKRNYIYVLGGTNSTSIIVGTQTLTGPAATSYFVAKYDTAGNFKWAKRFTGYASGIDCDSVSGAVYITGTQFNFFLQKLDSLGVEQWVLNPSVTTTSPPSRAYGSDLVVLSNGDIVLVGLWMHSNSADVLHIGSINLNNIGDGRFLARVNPAGTVVNAVIAHNSYPLMMYELVDQDYRKIYKLEKDNQDNIFVAWNRTGSPYVPESEGACSSIIPTIPAITTYKIFSINKFNSTLSFQNMFCFAGTGNICSPWFQDRILQDMTRDLNGDIYVSFGHSYWNGAYGLGSGCTGGGVGLLRIPNGRSNFDTIRYEQMSSPPITVFNSLVTFYSSGPPGSVRQIDFEAKQEIAQGTLPFRAFDAISIPGTRKNIITGLYAQNATVGPDILPSLAGDNFVMGAINSNCPTGPRNIRWSKPPTICSNDSLFLIAPAGFNYSWNTGQTTKTIRINSSGSYYATLSLPGCPSILSDTINAVINVAPPVPTISASGPLTFCQGDSVILTAPAGYSYQWSNGATSQSITVRTSGGQTVRVSNGNCSTFSIPVQVTVNPSTANPVITYSGSLNLCQGQTKTLTAPAGFSYLWNTNETTRSIQVNTSGAYTVTISSSAGCGNPQISPPVNKVVNPRPPAPQISPPGPYTVCTGQYLTLTAPSGYRYNWQFGGGSSNTQSVNIGSIYPTTTSASLFVIDTITNCSSPGTPFTVTIEGPDDYFYISSNGPYTFCQGGSVTMTAPSGYNYLWSTGATTQSIVVTTAGTYTVTISSLTNCGLPHTSLPETVVIKPLPSTTITASGPLNFCPGGSVMLSAPSGAGYTYHWNTGATSQNITVSTSGNFSVTVSSNGCSATSAVTTVSASNPPVPVITSSGSTTFCQGGSVTLNAPIGFTYLWSNGATSQSINVTTSGNYTVTVSNATGCSSTSVATNVLVVTPPPIPIITNSGPTTFCTGGSVTLSAPPGYTWLWSTGATTQSINVNTSGNYTVIIINGTGCSSTSVATVVTVNPLPSTPIITASGPTSFCQGGSITLTAPAGFSYLWNNGFTSQSINENTSGNYSVVVTNANGCSASSVATSVTVNPLPATPIITASGPTTFCQNSFVTLSTPAGFSYLWNTGVTTQSIPVSTSGNYFVTVTNANGCSSTSAQTTITVNPLPPNPVITASGPTTFCLGGSVILTAPAGLTYLWNNGSTSQSINVNTSGNYNVTITNANGCSNISALTTVQVNPLPATPVITASGPITFCQGGSVTLTAPAGFIYLWSNGLTSQSINVTTGGNYSVTVTNANSCSSASAVTTITVNPLPAVPVITAGGSTTFCQGGSVTLTAPAGFSYLWSNGATTQSIIVNSSGSYNVRVTNANNCSSSSSNTTVTVNPLPPVPVVTQNGNTLTSTAATSYQWYYNGSIIPGASAQSYTYTTGGDFMVTVTNAQGCSETSVIYTAMRNAFVDLGNGDRFFYSLFPNPVTTQLTINYQLEHLHTVSIRLISSTGRSIPIQNPVTRNAGSYTVNANAVAERIWTGVYILEFSVDDKKTTRTIIKF